MECEVLKTWRRLISTCRNDQEAAKIVNFGDFFHNIPIVTLDMNGYFPGGYSKTFVRKELVQLELSVFLEEKMQEKISTVINVYNNEQQDSIIFGSALQDKILKLGTS